MKFLVAVKSVIDPYVKIRVKTDQTGVETAQVKMAMNPFDEIALEEAIRWHEQQIASEIVLVSIGQENSKEILRHGLALGAHRAILVLIEHPISSFQTAKILQAITQREQPQVVMMGKQSIDGDNNQTPQMLAALNHWPQATFVSKLDFQMDESGKQRILAVREIDAGLETISISVPAVISTDLRLNQPRYATLPNIMKAKQKPLEMMTLQDLGIVLEQDQTIITVKNPPQRESGIILNSVEELVSQLNLKNEIQK